MTTASSRTILPFFAALLAALALFTACAPGVPSANSPVVDVHGTFQQPAAFDPDGKLDATAFASEDEFRAFVRSSGEAYNSIGYGMGGRGAMLAEDAAMAPTPAAAPSVAKSADAGAPSGSSGQGFSGTNNQVAGVDEADILKTDGEYLYTVTGRSLFLVKAYPGEQADVEGTVKLDFDPNGLFIDGTHLAVIGNFYDTDWFAKVGIRPRNAMTRVVIYDVSDRASPKEIQTYTLEGAYQGARLKDGVMYLVLTSGPDYRAEHPTPLVISGESVSGVPVRDVFWYPIPYQQVQFETTHAIGLRDASRPIQSITVAVEGAGTLYMSGDGIYLAATQWINEWQVRQEILGDIVASKLSVADRELIKKVQAVDPEVLPQQEKQAKIDQVYNEYVQYLPAKEQQDLNDEIDSRLQERMDALESAEWTVINRIDVAKDGSIFVGAAGKVPGSVYGQFALDESGGYLRIATTVNQRFRYWAKPMLVDTVDVAQDVAPKSGMDVKMLPPIDARSQQDLSRNNVYVLDDSLRVVGSLEGIAKGETIQSARFIGDRLYLVTFRQIDPFFVIDLSNPENPEILGTLKVPGFSRYLHPYDEHTIIGIGRDASATGRQEGLKISLYDVTNVEKPKELTSWVSNEEWAQSTAEWEHKAFLFDKDKELLVIPAYGYDWQANGKDAFNGAMVFRITPTSVKLRGIVDHGSNSNPYGAAVERSLWIGDALYTKSPSLLRINDIETLKTIKKIALEPSSDNGPYPIY